VKIEFLNDCFYYLDRRVELIKDEKMFTKSDLKDGMVVEIRDDRDGKFEKRLVVFGDTIVGLNGYSKLSDYTNDLISSIRNSFLDIVKVYKFKGFRLNGINKTTDLELIWERKEEPKEKVISVNEAMEQLEKIYNCKVKLEK
jgi:hypothetical protein